MKDELLTFLSPKSSKILARNKPRTAMESGFKAVSEQDCFLRYLSYQEDRLTTCTYDLEKALPLLSDLKRQRPREWDIHTNQVAKDGRKQTVEYQRREANQYLEHSVGSQVDLRRRPKGGVVWNRSGDADLRLDRFSRHSIQKRRKAESSMLVAADIPPTKEELQETWKMIDHWQEQMRQILCEDWDYKRKHWVEQCHNVLWNVKEDPTLIEQPSSEMFPKTLLPITFINKTDKHWLDVLISSARVEKIKAPDFEQLTYDPQGNHAMDEEFEFEIQFQFGFDIEELTWYIHFGVAKQGLNKDLCSVIAEFVGRSKFICDVQIYFKKSVRPWWEQDGIAKMQYYSKGQYVDIIDFAPMEEVYFVQE